MKLVLYGLCRDTLTIADTVRKEHEILGVSDGSAKIKAYGPYPFIRKECLAELEPDYIIVCVYTRKTYETIKKGLHDDFGIPTEKIISFHALFFEQRVDQVMLKAKLNQVQYDGLILGISYAALGIHPAYLTGKWANLAFPSEDIYTHKKVFQKCVEEYADCIRGLKRVVIDLYDYTVFNHDVSRTRKYIESIADGAYSEDSHNFQYNENYDSKDIEYLLQGCRGGIFLLLRTQYAKCSAAAF